jgi:hypothetical protein
VWWLKNKLEGCEQDNTSRTCLIRGLFLGDFLNIFTKKFKKYLIFWNFILYYYVKIYVKYSKKYFIFKKIEPRLQVIFVF